MSKLFSLKPKQDYCKANWLQRHVTHRNRYNRWLGGQKASNLFETQVKDLKNENKMLASKALTQQDELNERNAMFVLIAHDLRGPFNAIIGFLELTVNSFDDFSNEEKKSFVERAHRTALHLYSAQEEVLQLAGYYMGTLDMPLENVNVSGIAAKVIRNHEEAASRKGIELDSRIASDECIYGNGTFIEHVLANLLSNAIKFTKEGSVMVSTKRAPDNKFEIIVSDTGIGMPEEILKRLFKPSEKVGRKGTEGEKSNGIGLLMIASMVRRSGGKIWAESVEGKGSQFHVELPASQPPASSI